MQLDSRQLKAESQTWSSLVEDRASDKTTFSITCWSQKFPPRDHIVGGGTDP